MKTHPRFSSRARALTVPVACLASLLLLPLTLAAQRGGGHGGGGRGGGGHHGGGGHGGGGHRGGHGGHGGGHHGGWHGGGGHGGHHGGHRHGGYYGGHRHGGHHYWGGYYPYYSSYYPYYSSYYYPYYSPYYYGWSVGFGGYGGYGYGGYGGPAPYYRQGHASRTGDGALDIDIQPAETKVYVDGRYVGVADDFDGFPSYLWLQPGSHEIVFSLDGYRSIKQHLDVESGQQIQLREHLEEGSAEVPESYPDTPQRSAPRISRDPQTTQLAELRRAAGRLRLDIRPREAAVYLDGRFVGLGKDLKILTGLESGDHVLEAVLPGYADVRRTFTAIPGEEIEQRVELKHP